MCHKTRIGSFLLLAVCLFAGTNLQGATLFQQVGIASSPNPVGSGARAVGMGGAFIAIADDATAASWNPAGLIQLEKPEISVVGAYLYRKETFSSSVRPEIDNAGDVDEFNLNYLSATYPFRLFHRNIVVSINYQRLFEFKRKFEYRLDFSSAGVDLVQDKQFEQDGFLAAIGFASAIQIIPTLSIGVTLNLWTDQLLWDNGWEETFRETGRGTQGGVPVTIDTLITDKYSEFRGVSWNIGILWNISESFTVGAVVKTPFQASLRHEFRFSSVSRFGEPVNDEVSSQQSIREDVDLDMPLSYGFGLAWRASDALCFDLDVYRTHWSDYILKDSQGNELSPIDGRPKGDSDVGDTTQVRIGGEYLFIGRNVVVPVRGGFFYDPEPSEGSVKDFFGLSVGSGLFYKRLSFDLAYQFRWGRNVDTGNLIATSEADVQQHQALASLIVHF